MAAGLGIEEFWRHSPAQITFVIMATREWEAEKWGGGKKKKGTAADFVMKMGGVTGLRAMVDPAQPSPTPTPAP